jgi:mRNA-degrading endonuclease RelE of RelBE toxin-antitoxin system
MNYKIFPTHHFGKELKRLAKKYPSLKKEFASLINSIIENPKMGTFIGKDCYKIRIAVKSKGKGKSGGARVVTYLYIKTKVVYLLTIYDKSEKENISSNELLDMIESLDLE